MSIKFMNNSIKIGKGKSFADLVKEKVEKQAGSEVEVKTAEAEEADSSGQLEVEPLHQEGESEEPSAVTDENKKTETGKKESGKKEAGKKEKDDSDYDSDEKHENKDEKGGSGVDDEALEEAGEKDGEEEKEEKDCRTAETKPRFQKIAKLTEESKTLLRAEWESVYPKDYVDAMLAEY